MIALEQLKTGESATIQTVKNQAPDMAQLLEMGLTPGTRVRLVKFAPLGDPMEVEVRGYHLSIRCSEAKSILVKKDLSPQVA